MYMLDYIVYGSYNGGKFKMMDMNEGVQVNRRIYATMYPKERVSELRSKLHELEKSNEGWKFEIRKA